jgi:hypothetical protein
MTIEGQLEIDLRRGVIYFHCAETGLTVVRISQLEIPKSFNPETQQIDIIHMVGASYGSGRDAITDWEIETKETE